MQLVKGLLGRLSSVVVLFSDLLLLRSLYL
jgi:hypothetical protein